jgi:hypothetical protein
LIDLPLRLNRAGDSACIPPAAPDDVLLFECLLESFPILIAVDAQQDERLIGEAFYERPLVRVKFPAGASPMTPEAQ